MSFEDSGDGPLTAFAMFWKKVRHVQKKDGKKGVRMDAFQRNFVFSPKVKKVCFDCAGASGFRFRHAGPFLGWEKIGGTAGIP